MLGAEFADLTDQCACACSFSGCDPFVMFAKSVRWSIYSTRSSTKYQAQLIILLQHALGLTVGSMGWEKAGPVSRSAVRFTLFESLGLRHICCQLFKKLEEEKAREI